MNSPIPKILKEVKRLSKIKPLVDAKYYQFSLFANEEGKLLYHMISSWVGFTDDKPMREIRQASLVVPETAIQLFNSIKEPVSIINNKEDLQFFIYISGGHAIIEKTLVKKYLKQFLKPQVNAFTFDQGFINIESLPKEKLNRAPSPKLRMKVFDRDKRRCKICGASPANNEHVELHLHHIFPYGMGGITEENNLITLCNSCHKGLNPHLDLSLFNSIGIDMFSNRYANKSYDERMQLNLKANALRNMKLHGKKVRRLKIVQ
jgi:hypothetical protein